MSVSGNDKGASSVDALNGLQEKATSSNYNLLEGLGAIWENDEVIRGHLLLTGSLLKWPNEKLMGVISFATAAHNARVLWHVLDKWCPQIKEPKTVKIDDVRKEAGQVTNVFLVQTKEGLKSSGLFVPRWNPCGRSSTCQRTK